MNNTVNTNKKTWLKRCAEKEATIHNEPPAKKPNSDEQETTSRTNEEAKPCSIDEELSVFDSLPIEVVDMIFGHISSWSDLKKIRRVCKLWYKVINNRQNQSGVFIRDFRKIRMQSATYKHLVNCGFEYLNLCIGAYEMEKLPITLWEKIGVKIRSLEFTGCPLGDRILENVILFCPNLRILRINLNKFKRELDANIAIISMETLEKLEVVRHQLETFEIGVYRLYPSFFSSFTPIQNVVEYETWKQIFEALFQIFPNVVNFSWTKYHYGYELSKCAFTRETAKVLDNSKVASVLAHLLSDTNWRTAFDVLATLGLTRISIHISKDLQELTNEDDRTSIFNFFKVSTKLKFVHLKMDNFFFLNVFKSILFQILDNCRELCELEYFNGASSWLHEMELERNELSRLIKSLSNLKKVSMSNFCLQPASHSLSSSHSIYENELEQESFERTSIFWFENYPYLRHLILKNVSDDILQRIFEFLVCLRSLKVVLSSKATNFGITGRLNGNPYAAITGYSINRLQNLEKLTIKCEKFKGTNIDEKIYLDFHLPNLHFLRCYLPQDSSTFALMGAAMPSLKTIHLASYSSKVVSMECLLKLGSFSKNLHSLYTDIRINVKDAQKIFKVCPTLRFLRAYCKTFFYDPFKRKAVISRQ